MTLRSLDRAGVPRGTLGAGRHVLQRGMATPPPPWARSRPRLLQLESALAHPPRRAHPQGVPKATTEDPRGSACQAEQKRPLVSYVQMGGVNDLSLHKKGARWT
jgi:hypothetical protein